MRKTAAFWLILGLLTAARASGAPDSTAQPGQIDPCQIRAGLLMDAAARTGVCTPEQAAALWAEGLCARSAALQYAVMTDRLKAAYAAQLDALGSNWVTGVSSPWVNGFAITEIQRPNARQAVVGLRMETISSGTPPAYYDARLWLVREGDFWRIERLWTDDALYPYTLYRPEA